MKKIRFFIAVTILVAGLSFAADFKPKAGFVPDEKTAIAIAVAVWTPICGEENIQKEKPFKTVLKDGVWRVEGTLPDRVLGGVAVAEISKGDARILRISHGQ